MADYIRRDDALKAVASQYGPCRSPAQNRLLDEIRIKIRRISAADVAEVVRAQWEEADWREYDAQSCETIRYPTAAIVCTNCRCAFKKDALWSRNHCPNCGAKMDDLKALVDALVILNDDNLAQTVIDNNDV